MMRKSIGNFFRSPLPFMVAFLALMQLLAPGCGADEAEITTTQTATKNPPATPDSTSAAIGDHAVKISEFVCPYAETGDPLTPGMVTASLQLEIKNASDADYIVGPGDFTLESESRESFRAVTGYDVAGAIDEDITIAPEEAAAGVLFFDFPDDIRVVYLVDNSSAETLKIELPRPTGQ